MMRPPLLQSGKHRHKLLKNQGLSRPIAKVKNPFQLRQLTQPA
ncbi:hypothetical protein [Cytobacillus sp. BC1816]